MNDNDKFHKIATVLEGIDIATKQNFINILEILDKSDSSLTASDLVKHLSPPDGPYILHPVYVAHISIIVKKHWHLAEVIKIDRKSRVNKYFKTNKTGAFLAFYSSLGK